MVDTKITWAIASDYSGVLATPDGFGRFTTEEEALETLKEEAPHFEFRTWKGKPTPQYPDPRTNHVWNGAVAEPDGAVGGEGGDVQTDDTPPADDEPADTTTDDEPAADDDTPPEPAKDDTWMYTPPGQKKPIDCTVEKVYAAKRLVDLKSNADPRKKFPGVSWDKITVPT